ncbi:MAG: type II secretion system inner membrane protein GspF [Proteobacteria bacterium]|nr:type II secretion system inner membrane protein GspF [Pseudomonadota bacterium]
MPLYEYKGLNKVGKPVKGTKDAASKAALREALLKAGVYLSEATEKTGAKADAKNQKGVLAGVKIGGGVSKQDIKDFTSSFCTLQKAAIPLVECLNALADQAENEALKAALTDIKAKVSEGSSLANAMADYPKMFDTLYISMIRAGESSGSLDIVLERLTGFLESQLRLKSRIMGAMVYPIIMVVIGVLLMTVLLVFIVPRVTKLFEQQRKELPGITKFLLASSDFMIHFWWLVAIIIGVLIFLFRKWTSTKSGRLKWDTFLLKIPLFGGLFRMVSLSRFAKTLSTLLASGVPLLKALEITKSVLGNEMLANVVENAHDQIKEGETLAAPLKRSGEFPPLMVHMISVGERAGRLEEMLNSVADNYEEQVGVKVDALTSMLEPLMIVVMGGTIGFVVFAIMLPIMQLSDGFG